MLQPIDGREIKTLRKTIVQDMKLPKPASLHSSCDYDMTPHSVHCSSSNVIMMFSLVASKHRFDSGLMN